MTDCTQPISANTPLIAFRWKLPCMRQLLLFIVNSFAGFSPWETILFFQSGFLLPAFTFAKAVPVLAI